MVSCEQSRAPALGQNTRHCRWQMKPGVLCAAVNKIEDHRNPDDFIGRRKPEPAMPAPIKRCFVDSF